MFTYNIVVLVCIVLSVLVGLHMYVRTNDVDFLLLYVLAFVAGTMVHFRITF